MIAAVLTAFYEDDLAGSMADTRLWTVGSEEKRDDDDG